jgi:hypothetical protein
MLAFGLMWDFTKHLDSALQETKKAREERARDQNALGHGYCIGDYGPCAVGPALWSFPGRDLSSALVPPFVDRPEIEFAFIL